MPTRATRNAARSARGRRPAHEARASASGPSSTDGKRERNKAQNRAEILVAAREVFTELGYDAATVRDVIRRTRLASGTFYNYFPDKESLFRAVLRESEDRRHEWLGRVERRNVGFEEYLRDTFHAYFEFVVSDRETFDLMRRNSQTIRAFARDPIILDERERLSRLLASAMSDGELPQTDAKFLASAILGVAFEVGVIMVERDPVDLRGATEFVTNLFLGFFARLRHGAEETTHVVAKDGRRRA
jgi:AcrR family transcriptional regulator